MDNNPTILLIKDSDEQKVREISDISGFAIIIAKEDTAVFF